MDKNKIIELLFNEVVNTVDYDETTKKAVGEMYDKVIVPLMEKHRDWGFEAEDIINHVCASEAFFYFEQGFKCAELLRSVI